VQDEDLTIGIPLTQTELTFIPIEVNINTTFIFFGSNIISTVQILDAGEYVLQLISNSILKS